MSDATKCNEGGMLSLCSMRERLSRSIGLLGGLGFRVLGLGFRV